MVRKPYPDLIFNLSEMEVAIREYLAKIKFIPMIKHPVKILKNVK
jgi:hypothetical protein